ncbi:hypothetical protein HMPREF9134_01307 [Porphyromonas catoniae F0037]|jgi:hypothetical protein|uniref:Zinc finger CHC2-type domain-containing protein n=1 Tax=Porphyromonas catoniae F0037 TaxID=1127696 RepID=L1NBR9_9PORP|nr:hypothetical protein HMPREF9134_01307 [Porphyromonas catoniae F0037]
MNKEYQLQQIKSIPIADYLSSLGIKPIKQYGGYALYHAPYRDDHNASLKVDFVRNLWYDFGLCRGGSIIDLVILLKGCGIREAIAELTGEATSSFHSFAIPQPPKAEQKLILPTTARRILSISKDLPPYLQHYLKWERGVDFALAKPYLHAVPYEVGSRAYTAIGFSNQAGGYELRDDKAFKGTIAPKDISVIRGTNGQGAYNLFEGFIDFLSYLTMKGKEAQASSIILNSVSNIHKAVVYLREHHISEVRAFLDSDEAGRKALQYLREAGIEVKDMSGLYAPTKTSTNGSVPIESRKSRLRLLASEDFADSAKARNSNRVFIG